TSYEVFEGDTCVAIVSGTTATIDGLTPDSEHTYTVIAKDAAGNASVKSAAVKVRTKALPDTQAPTVPGNVRSTSQTTTAVDLAWDASTDNIGVTSYEVFEGDTCVAIVTGTTATVSGLTPNTEHSYTVIAKDAAGNASAKSAAVKVRTKADQGPSIVKYGYRLAGSTKIKAAHGEVALAGSIQASVNLSTGAVEADLALNPTTGHFKAFGFLPVRAEMQFVQEGKTTGSLAGGVLRSTSKVTVKLPRITLLGIPISSSPNCRTQAPASIPLESKPGFDPLRGGTAAGTYTLPALTGCGPLTNLISGVTSGPGNTIELRMVPLKSAPQARAGG
ncbi:fibronectin type III domain-containing protein, partial [Actinosynnema sp. NPDC023658]|uniref:fibronectin type III domain-containing protein n=1 Tax=Actinosynnema sp. NPDC023658 TaxID=3155465 RepID=UPI0033EF5DBC